MTRNSIGQPTKMDITALFKASVKTVRLRNKSLPAPDKNRILRRGPKDEFTIKTKDICHQITQLRNLLIENRAAYMRFAYHLKRSAHMTDEERDIIDQESEKIIGICTQFINNLKLESRKKTVPKQVSEHMNAILELLSLYLKNVLKIYNEQKAYRIQHELETYKLLKLEPNKKLIPIRPATDRIKLSGGDLIDSDDDSVHSNELPLPPTNDIDSVKEESTVKQKQRKVAVDEDLERKFALEEDEISAEDIQMFESENVQLYNELKGLSDEVEQIEKNVVDIAKLQEVFTEKVTLQKGDIDRIANTVVGATENVRDANEQIKQAIQRNAGLRVWALFFLLVMSFSLLFLDWYND